MQDQIQNVIYELTQSLAGHVTEFLVIICNVNS